jgi:alkylation response protein AidB-like acyl-CoA dehydrogenase
MDFTLSREDTMIKDAIRDWVAKECTRDTVAELDEKDAYPTKLAKKLSQLGFCGMTITEEDGGEGRNILGACIVAETIATMYPALARWYTGPAFYGGAVISTHGSGSQKDKYLAKCASGKLMVAIAQNETDSGSDLKRIQTTAAKNGNRFIINGEKNYIYNADRADLIIVMAKDKSREAGTVGFTLFCVERKRQGVSIEPIEKLGYKGNNFCRIRFDSVEAGEDDILGGAAQFGQGALQWESILDIILLAVTSEAVGLAQGAFDYALDYAKQRVQFGQAIGKFNAIRNMLVEMNYEIESARMMLYRAAWLADQQQPFSREIAMAKCLAGDAAGRAAMEGLQIFGGYGYTMEYDIQRYIRDAVSLTSAGAGLEVLKARIGDGLGL